VQFTFGQSHLGNKGHEVENQGTNPQAEIGGKLSQCTGEGPLGSLHRERPPGTRKRDKRFEIRGTESGASFCPGMYSGSGNAIASWFMVPADQNTSHSNGPLDAALESLLGLARQAALHSYAPYSGFRVGAALRLTNGETVTGTNVENVSYGLTICAERAAWCRR